MVKKRLVEDVTFSIFQNGIKFKHLDDYLKKKEHEKFSKLIESRAKNISQTEKK